MSGGSAIAFTMELKADLANGGIVAGRGKLVCTLDDGYSGNATHAVVVLSSRYRAIESSFAK